MQMHEGGGSVPGTARRGIVAPKGVEVFEKSALKAVKP